MTYSIEKPDKRIWPILKLYSTGDISGYNAAYEIQALKIPGYSNPSISEVILWSKAVGYGIPQQSEEDAEAEAAEALKRLKKSDE